MFKVHKAQCRESVEVDTLGELINPFTPKFKKYVLPTFLKRNV